MQVMFSDRAIHATPISWCYHTGCKLKMVSGDDDELDVSF